MFRAYRAFRVYRGFLPVAEMKSKATPPGLAVPRADLFP